MDLLIQYSPEIASGLLFILAFFVKKFTAIKKFVKAIVDAAQDDKITPEEVQNIVLQYNAVKKTEKKITEE